MNTQASATSEALFWLDSPSSPFSPLLQQPAPENPFRHLIKPIKIGNVQLPNNLVLAPMAGVTDGSFRLLCSRLGVGYTVSELASSKAILMQNRQTINLVRFQAQARPYAVQIFGAEIDAMSEAAKIVDSMQICDVIDINMGCPVPKVVKTGAGSAMMNNPELAGKILAAVKNAVKVPVTIKCRIGWNEKSINVADFVKRMLDNGADAITVHARTRQAGYSGPAQWHHLEGLGAICGKIPFFANGDISEPEHLSQLHEISGCSGYMIGRGCVGRPWLFAELLGHKLFSDPRTRYMVFRHHLLDMLMEIGPKAVPLFRVHLFNYLKNHANAARARHQLCEERSPHRIFAVGQALFENLPLPGIS